MVCSRVSYQPFARRGACTIRRRCAPEGRRGPGRTRTGQEGDAGARRGTAGCSRGFLDEEVDHEGIEEGEPDGVGAARRTGAAEEREAACGAGSGAGERRKEEVGAV